MQSIRVLIYKCLIPTLYMSSFPRYKRYSDRYIACNYVPKKKSQCSVPHHSIVCDIAIYMKSFCFHKISTFRTSDMSRLYYPRDKQVLTSTNAGCNAGEMRDYKLPKQQHSQLFP